MNPLEERKNILKASNYRVIAPIDFNHKWLDPLRDKYEITTKDKGNFELVIIEEKPQNEDKLNGE